jgi:hypothetical protein
MFDLGIPFKDIGQQTKKLRSWLMDKTREKPSPAVLVNKSITVYQGLS